MASSFNGATALVVNAAPVATTPLTLSAWVRLPAPPTSTGVLMQVARASGADHWFALQMSSTGNAVAQAIAGGAAFSSTTTAAVAPGRWHHFAAVFASANSRVAYLDGLAGPVDSNNVAPTSLDRTVVAARWRPTASAYQNQFTGDLAFPAVWSAALTVAEIASLAAGAPTQLVRPSALAEFWPLRPHEVRNANGARGGLGLDAIGSPPTWADDPAPLAVRRPAGVYQLAEVPRLLHDAWIGLVASSAGRAQGRPKRWYPGLSPRPDRSGHRRGTYPPH